MVAEMMAATMPLPKWIPDLLVIQRAGVSKRISSGIFRVLRSKGANS